MLQQINRQLIIQTLSKQEFAINDRLDGKNGRQLWEKAKQLYQSGAQEIVIDMKGVRSVSTHGVQILTRIDELFSPLPQNNIVRYKRHPANNKGRLKRVKRRAIIPLKLLNLDPQAGADLSESGFTQFIAIYGDA